ncbi:MAG: DUF4191 domain-containing protein [Micromonosporaceae bacterium]|jgi:hypothetical protein
MAKGEQQKVGFFGRLKQVGMVFSLTARADRWFLPLAVAAVVIPLALTVLLVAATAGWLWIPAGVMFALLALLIVLNARSSRVFMEMAEQQRGAVASVVERMRGDWRVTPAIASTTQMDMVHLVLSRCGVVLLGEGDPNRLRGMLAQEKRRLSKVIGTAPLYDFMVGRGENQVPLAKLRWRLMKLPRTLKGRDVNALDKRLKALASRPRMPQGAISRDMLPKGVRLPRAARGR